MSQGLTGAVSGASAVAGSTASTASMTLPANISPATYPITGTTPITAITASPQDGRIALLKFVSQGCRVVMGGNLLINGDYLSSAGGILALVADGSNWREIDRSDAVLQPYNAHPNGGFEGWQFGTSFAACADAVYFADRWVSNKSGTGVWTIAQDASVPAVAWNAAGALTSAKITVTTADASMAASDLYAVYSVIEGYDIRDLMNGFAVSWWAKAHRTGTYCVSFVNKAFTRSYIVEYTIAIADTWQYFTAVVPAPTGTWTLDTQIGMYCLFSLAMGSTFGSGASANTWLSTGSYTTVNQINGVAATSDTFSLWGLNVVPGTVPQPYHPQPFALQWERLKRYYQPIINGVSTGVGAGYALTTSRAFIMVPLLTEMGGIPTLVFSTASDFAVFSLGTAVQLNSLATFINNPKLLWLDCGTAGGTLVAGQGTVMYANTGAMRLGLVWNPA